MSVQLPRKITYEEELNHDFAREVAEATGGDKLYACIQCGTCSGGCPVSPYMDYAPRRIVAMVRAGFEKKVLESSTIWLCASCYNCTVECPKQIKITDVMYALKQRAIKKGVYPSRFPIPVLAREFFDIVMRYGRNHESELLTRMFMKTNPLNALKQAFLGMRLFFTGRMGLLPHKIRARADGKGDLETIMKALDEK